MSVQAFQFPPMMHQAMYTALTSPELVMPDGTRLFPPALIDIRLGGDGAITDSNRQITLPLRKIIITLGWPYGSERSNRGPDAGTVDVEQSLKISVWSDSAADSEAVAQRLQYARDLFPAVFSAQKICILGGQIQTRMRPYSPVDGLAVFDTTWGCFFERRNG